MIVFTCHYVITSSSQFLIFCYIRTNVSPDSQLYHLVITSASGSWSYKLTQLQISSIEAIRKDNTKTPLINEAALPFLPVQKKCHSLLGHAISMTPELSFMKKAHCSPAPSQKRRQNIILGIMLLLISYTEKVAIIGTGILQVGQSRVRCSQLPVKEIQN